MRKTAAVLILSLSTLSPTILSTAPVRAQEATKDLDALVMPWRFYRRLAKCETNLTVNHSSRSYTGMYGIARGTWQRWSNSSSAAGKTPIEQARVVDNIAWLGHTTDGVYKWPAGPWGWGAIKANCMGLQTFICRSHHPKVQRWKRGC
jgi:hypothetical protein